MPFGSGLVYASVEWVDAGKANFVPWRTIVVKGQTVKFYLTKQAI
jgi:hypothetical protein